MKNYRLIFTIPLLAIFLALSAMPVTPYPFGEGWGEASSSPSGEGWDEAPLLQQIERNNTTLSALRAEAEARKLDNRTGITLPDPEVGYKRMWEDAEQSGNLSEFTVEQSFDLSTVLGYKSRAAEDQNHLIDVEYRLVRMEILLEAQLACIDLAYYNALADELDRRLSHARRVVDAEKRRLEGGDTDVLSYNNVVLSLSALEAERASIATEQAVLVALLDRLNGGKPLDGIEALDGEQSFMPMPDWDSFVAQAMKHSPAMALARTGREVAGSGLSLAKSQHLPILSAAYINERHTIGDRSQGVAVGVSLPLWANKNRVRSARAALQAAEAREADAEVQLRSHLVAGYERVQGLQRTAALYRNALAESNNTELLVRAMDEGYISVLEYLQGIELYYDYLDRSLSADRDYRRALAELEAWKL